MCLGLSLLAPSGVWRQRSPVSAQTLRPEATAMAGAWTRNRNPGANGQPGARGPQGAGSAGGRRDGGLDGPFGPRPSGVGGPLGVGNSAQNARRADALREITDPPDHLVVTVTGTMVIVAGQDGRTTRLATDGSRITDQNTGMERRTRWTAGALVSEISGLGPKITQSFSVDAERRQLRIRVEIAEGGGRLARSATYVYDASPP
jgi:hypothetical protein